MGAREQVIHMKWIRPLLLEDTSPTETLTWEPPLFTHTEQSDIEIENESSTLVDNSLLERPTQSGHVIHLINYFGYRLDSLN